MANQLYLSRVEVLATTWDRWAETGRDLSAGEWTAASRCEGWNVACLYAHASQFPLGLSGPTPPPPTGDGTVLTAAEVLAGFNRPGGVAHTVAGGVSAHARQEASRMTAQELVDRFRGPASVAVANLRDADPDQVMAWPAVDGGITLGEGVRIVVLETVVHLLDVLHALGREPDLEPAALQETACLLAELAPPVEFIEAATGRQSANPFPVLR